MKKTAYVSAFILGLYLACYPIYRPLGQTFRYLSTPWLICYYLDHPIRGVKTLLGVDSK